jgi:predicted nucleic acid-binding protein
MTLVFNASPIIVLAKSGLLDRILPLGTHVIIPRPVAEEINAVKDPHDPAAVWLRKPDAQPLLTNAPECSPFVGAWDLGAGESSVIMLSLDGDGRQAVLDDLAARRCASALGIRVIGTIGLLLMAKQRGLIPAIRPALQSVEDAGLFLSASQRDLILSRSGE